MKSISLYKYPSLLDPPEVRAETPHCRRVLREEAALQLTDVG